MLRLLFPAKCTLCHTLLSREETDLCHNCREHTEKFTKSKSRIPFVAHWTALWYYKENVRKSIHRFKFRSRRHYASVFSRHLAMHLADKIFSQADLISWIPISPLRKLGRGYDQSELLARAIAKELGIPVVPVLRKVRHTQPQSGLPTAAQRRANIVGAYRPVAGSKIAGKRILLIDDVVTTGATASECAKVLQIAGANEIYLAAVAAAAHDKK